MVIAGRELRSLFVSPLAWSLLAAVQLIVAYLFFLHIDRFLAIQPELAAHPDAPGVTALVVAPLFDNTALVLLFVVPLLTMRLVSEERRSGALGLLLCAPVSMGEIILGKYLGALGLLGLMLLSITLMPMSLLAVTPIDLGMLAACILALALMLAAFAAVGLYASTLTGHPALAAITALSVLLLFWLLDLAVSTGGSAEAVLRSLSLFGHYQNLLRGYFQSSDLVFFLLLAFSFLGLGIRRLQTLGLEP